MTTRQTRQIIDRIVSVIHEATEDERSVTLLLPGGSNAQYIRPLFAELVPYQENLSISLADERYVPERDERSNWHSVAAALSVIPGARAVPILSDGMSRHDVTVRFASFLEDARRQNGVIVALLGIGEDGHIAGIKPYSPACDSEYLADDYTGEDFERITITGRFFASIDLVVVAATGSAKAPVIDRLVASDVDPREMPAQYAKRAADYEMIYYEKEGV